MERAGDLAAKYSVLRDDRSFQEAMDCIDSQRQTIDALLRSGTGDTADLERDRDQLDAEKMHTRIQQGREAFQRAIDMADLFVKKTAGKRPLTSTFRKISESKLRNDSNTKGSHIHVVPSDLHRADGTAFFHVRGT